MLYSQIKLLARELRNNPTPEEEFLWTYLKGRKLAGLKFLRQHPIIYQTIGFQHFCFIPDFYCAKVKVAIELDGRIHLSTKEHDKHRDEILSEMGIKVLRIKNEDLNDVNCVLHKILQQTNNNQN
jgi:very-short-patch-repair endonuclease